MDWNVFWRILFLGEAFVLVQGACAWFNGFFTQAQMKQRGVKNGWSFVEHGGMWADVLVISPLVAYFAAKYRFTLSWVALLVLVITVTLALIMGRAYSEGGKLHPVPHTHDGKTTIAGWIHGAFAIAVMWTCTMIYLGETTPSVPRSDLLILSSILTPFFFFGVANWSKRWVFSTAAKWQVGISIILIWLVTIVRIALM